MFPRVWMPPDWNVSRAIWKAGCERLSSRREPPWGRVSRQAPPIQSLSLYSLQLVRESKCMCQESNAGNCLAHSVLHLNTVENCLSITATPFLGPPKAHGNSSPRSPPPRPDRLGHIVPADLAEAWKSPRRGPGRHLHQDRG